MCRGKLLPFWTTPRQKPPPHLHVPDERAVEKVGPHFPNPAQVPRVPDVHAVVLVHARQPVAAGVKGQGNGVRVGGVRPAGETHGRKKTPESAQPEGSRNAVQSVWTEA